MAKPRRSMAIAYEGSAALAGARIAGRLQAGRTTTQPAAYLEPARDDLAIRVRLIRALSALLDKPASPMRTSRESLDDVGGEE